MPLETPRGFTGHEHLDALGLIHMNGRVYDPELGRFLSADPIIQFPETTQGFNRYSYAANNPLSFTDPSGFFIKKLLKKIKKFIKKYWQSIAQIAVATYLGPIGAAAFAGIMTAVNGGSLTDAITATAITYGTAMAFQGVGAAFKGVDTSFLSAGHLLKTAAHGVVGGVSSALRGGSFKAGFLAGAAAQFAAPVIGGIGEGTADYYSRGNIMARTAAAAVAGGVGAELGGGKFKNGAVTGAFSRLFNDEAEAHRAQKAYKEQLAEQEAQQDAASKSLWVGGKVEVGIHFLFPGINSGFGTLGNLLTGEICTYAEHCVRLGPGILVGAGGRGTLLIGPESGKDLDGFNIGMGFDIIVPGAPGAGGSAMVRLRTHNQ